MKLNIIGKNVQISDAVKDQVEKKLSKLDKMFKHETDAHVNIEKQKNNHHHVEITIPVQKGTFLRAVGKAEDMYKAIDDASDKIIRQMKKHKTKLQKRFQANDSIRFDQVPEQEVVEEEAKIVKTKSFRVYPMTTEEAVLQMEMLHHDFFVFQNGESGELNVVYKRNDGNFGHLEPTL